MPDWLSKRTSRTSRTPQPEQHRHSSHSHQSHHRNSNHAAATQPGASHSGTTHSGASHSGTPHPGSTHPGASQPACSYAHGSHQLAVGMQPAAVPQQQHARPPAPGQPQGGWPHAAYSGASASTLRRPSAPAVPPSRIPHPASQTELSSYTDLNSLTRMESWSSNDSAEPDPNTEAGFYSMVATAWNGCFDLVSNDGGVLTTKIERLLGEAHQHKRGEEVWPTVYEPTYKSLVQEKEYWRGRWWALVQATQAARRNPAERGSSFKIAKAIAIDLSMKLQDNERGHKRNKHSEKIKDSGHHHNHHHRTHK